MRIFENLSQCVSEISRDLDEMGITTPLGDTKGLIGHSFKILEVPPTDLFDGGESTDKSQIIDSVMKILNSETAKEDLSIAVDSLKKHRTVVLNSQHDFMNGVIIQVDENMDVRVVRTVDHIKNQDMLPILIGLNGLMVSITTLINFRADTVAPYRKGSIYVVPGFITQ